MAQLVLFLEEYQRVVNLYIDYLWYSGVSDAYSIDFGKVSDTWLTLRARMCAGRQAFGMCSCKSLASRRDEFGLNVLPYGSGGQGDNVAKQFDEVIFTDSFSTGGHIAPVSNAKNKIQCF